MEFNNQRLTTAIQVRIKRHSETYFILCDEYEDVEQLINRLLVVFHKLDYRQENQEEPMQLEDVRLALKNRVSYT